MFRKPYGRSVPGRGRDGVTLMSALIAPALAVVLLGTAMDPAIGQTLLEDPVRTSEESLPAQCTGSGSVQLPSSEGIVAFEHCVNVGHGVSLYVTEKFTMEATARNPRRALLLLPATLVDSRQWNTEVEGNGSFNGLERAAREGFFAYTVDYWGYGRSSKPPDGREVTKDRLLAHMGAVVEWIRQRSGTPQVDMVGISLGSLLASALGGRESPIPNSHVGKVVLTAVVYKRASPVLSLTLLSPAGCALLEGSPNGYTETNSATYAPLIANSEPEVQVWCYQNCPGRYAVGPTLTGCSLPVFDAADGRAPALVLWGDRDLVSPRDDVEEFAADYGGHAEFRVTEGGAHTLHWEPVRETFWQQTIAFLNQDRAQKPG